MTSDLKEALSSFNRCQGDTVSRRPITGLSFKAGHNSNFSPTPWPHYHMRPLEKFQSIQLLTTSINSANAKPSKAKLQKNL